MATNNTKFELTGIGMNSVASLDSNQGMKRQNEREFIEHIMRRTLYSVLTRMAMLATRNPSGLIEDLKDVKAVKDNAYMWAKHVADEMNIDNIFSQDIDMMHKICGKSD